MEPRSQFAAETVALVMEPRSRFVVVAVVAQEPRNQFVVVALEHCTAALVRCTPVVVLERYIVAQVHCTLAVALGHYNLAQVHYIPAVVMAHCTEELVEILGHCIVALVRYYTQTVGLVLVRRNLSEVEVLGPHSQAVVLDQGCHTEVLGLARCILVVVEVPEHHSFLAEGHYILVEVLIVGLRTGPGGLVLGLHTDLVVLGHCKWVQGS